MFIAVLQRNYQFDLLSDIRIGSHWGSILVVIKKIELTTMWAILLFISLAVVIDSLDQWPLDRQCSLLFMFHPWPVEYRHWSSAHESELKSTYWNKRGACNRISIRFQRFCEMLNYFPILSLCSLLFLFFLGSFNLINSILLSGNRAAQQQNKRWHSVSSMLT